MPPRSRRLPPDRSSPQDGRPAAAGKPVRNRLGFGHSGGASPRTGPRAGRIRGSAGTVRAARTLGRIARRRGRARVYRTQRVRAAVGPPGCAPRSASHRVGFDRRRLLHAHCRRQSFHRWDADHRQPAIRGIADSSFLEPRRAPRGNRRRCSGSADARPVRPDTPVGRGARQPPVRPANGDSRECGCRPADDPLPAPAAGRVANGGRGTGGCRSPKRCRYLTGPGDGWLQSARHR